MKKPTKEKLTPDQFQEMYSSALDNMKTRGRDCNPTASAHIDKLEAENARLSSDNLRLSSDNSRLREALGKSDTSLRRYEVALGRYADRGNWDQSLYSMGARWMDIDINGKGWEIAEEALK